MRRTKSHFPRSIQQAYESLEDTHPTTALYDLAPCPVCGGYPKLESWQSFNGSIFILNCIVKCWHKDHPSAGPFGTLDEARSAWNMQAVLCRQDPEVPIDPDFPAQDYSGCFDNAEDLDE